MRKSFTVIPARTQNGSNDGNAGRTGEELNLVRVRLMRRNKLLKRCWRGLTKPSRATASFPGKQPFQTQMRTRNLLRWILAFWLVIASAVVTSPQNTQPSYDSNKTLNYGFVSPNTRDDLKLEEAIRGMYSASELSFMRRARDLGCVVRSRI